MRFVCSWCFFVLATAAIVSGCGGTESPPANTGGATSAGGSQSSGGAQTAGGSQSSGGAQTGGSQTGGQSTGGQATGGAQATGGKATGGAQSSGGAQSTGGTQPTGGSQTSGGAQNTGGQSTGGSQSSGGAQNTGGQSTGGQSTGGAQNTGGQSTGGSGPTVNCDDTATLTGTVSVRYGSAEIPVTGKTKSYFLQTNWWHKYGSQTVSYNGLSFTVGDPGNTSVPATDGSPTGFPSLFIGTYSGHASKGSNLPKQVSALTTVPTIFSVNSLDHDTSNSNATYDVWFTANGNTLPTTASSPGTGGAYLMVWLYKPASRQPRGGTGSGTAGVPNYAARTVSGVTGTWDVWVDSSTNPPCISYVSTTPIPSLSFDLNKFIQDSVTNSYGITNSMYLSIVFAGFEIWSAGDGLQVKQFCAQVN
jgi:hypothetical protein